jgi:hypothetical protein
MLEVTHRRPVSYEDRMELVGKHLAPYACMGCCRINMYMDYEPEKDTDPCRSLYWCQWKQVMEADQEDVGMLVDLPTQCKWRKEKVT